MSRRNKPPGCRVRSVLDAWGLPSTTNSNPPPLIHTNTPANPTTTSNRHTKTAQHTTITKKKKKKNGKKKKPQKRKIKKQKQTTLYRSEAPLAKTKYYGHDPKIKLKQTFRYWGGSFDNFILRVKNSDKNKTLFARAEEYKVDQMGGVETGIDWRIIPVEDGLYERTKAASGPVKATYAHNTTEAAKTQRQHGGAAMFAFAESVPRIINSSEDPEKLGRWVT